jgi:hypothetical protein
MNVVDTVAAKIKAWPFSHETRADALKHIFLSRYWQWVDGQLVNTELSELDRGDSSPFLDEKEDEMLFMRIHRSRDNALIAWRMENAELLAGDEYSHFTHTCLYIAGDYPDSMPNGNHFDDMPDDVQDDWKEAALTTAQEMLRITEDAEPKTHEFSARKKVIAFLALHKRVDTTVVDNRIDELEKELADLRASREGMIT